MAQNHFIFRLSDKTGEIVLRALEGRFLAAGTEERKEIARVTVRLRRKLQNLTNVTRGK